MPDAIVVDGSNVAYAERSHGGQPKVSNLVAMRDALEARGNDPIVIVDATLRHEIDDPAQLESLFDQETVHQAPAGTDADLFVLESADRLGAPVVSNDEFEDYRERYPWIAKRRMPFMIIRGEILLYDRMKEDA